MSAVLAPQGHRCHSKALFVIHCNVLRLNRSLCMTLKHKIFLDTNYPIDFVSTEERQST